MSRSLPAAPCTYKGCGNLTKNSSGLCYHHMGSMYEVTSADREAADRLSLIPPAPAPVRIEVPEPVISDRPPRHYDRVLLHEHNGNGSYAMEVMKVNPDGSVEVKVPGRTWSGEHYEPGTFINITARGEKAKAAHEAALLQAHAALEAAVADFEGDSGQTVEEAGAYHDLVVSVAVGLSPSDAESFCSQALGYIPDEVAHRDAKDTDIQPWAWEQ